MGYESWRGSRTFVAVTISVAIFTDMFLYAVVVPVLPFSLSDRAGIVKGDVQFWSSFLLSAYTATFFVGSLVFGWATDQMSKRSSLLFVGLFLMLGATVMLALSRTISLLVISRTLQGMAGAIVWSAGLALLLDTFGHARFGKMMAMAVICQTSALTVAPVVGGFLFAKLGFNAVMAVCFALVTVDIILRLLMVENSTRSSRIRSDLKKDPEDPTITPVGGSFPVDDRTPLIGKPAGATTHSSWYIFILIVKHPRVLATLLCFANIWALQTSFDAVLPYRVRDLFGWSSAGSGLVFLPIVLPAFAATAGDMFYVRWGARKVTSALFLFGVPAFACLAIIRNNDTLNKALLCVFLFLSGLVLNLTVSPLTSDMTYGIQELEYEYPESFGDNGGYGRAFGMLNCAFAFGGMIGPAASGLLVARSGWTTLCLVMSAMMAINAIFTLSFVGGLPPTPTDCDEGGFHSHSQVE